MAKPDSKVFPCDVAMGAAVGIIDKLQQMLAVDGISVHVRVSAIKRDADITKPSMHEVLASVEAQHLEPST